MGVDMWRCSSLFSRLKSDDDFAHSPLNWLTIDGSTLYEMQMVTGSKRGFVQHFGSSTRGLSEFWIFRTSFIPFMHLSPVSNIYNICFSAWCLEILKYSASCDWRFESNCMCKHVIFLEPKWAILKMLWLKSALLASALEENHMWYYSMTTL